MSVDTIQAIAAVRTGLGFSEEAISTEELTMAINAIHSKAITPEERAHDFFHPSEVEEDGYFGQMGSRRTKTAESVSRRTPVERDRPASTLAISR